jgi:hypothetical protein
MDRAKIPPHWPGSPATYSAALTAPGQNGRKWEKKIKKDITTHKQRCGCKAPPKSEPLSTHRLTEPA